jgi:hypothetical protein
MKRALILLLFLNTSLLFSQTFCEDYCTDFDDDRCLDQLTIDKIEYPDNIWQIGKPKKSVINTFSHNLKVIVTDTINPYPVNNHSVFIIKNTATNGDIYGCKIFHGFYNVHADSLNDYGLIEFSPDNGITWIDLINDTLYSSSFIWYGSKPILTGNSNGWEYFEMLFADNGSVFNMEYGDTIMFRFSFFSDSIFEGLDGLAYDEFCFYEFVEGVSETRFAPIKSKIYPNPSRDHFIIEFENPAYENFELSVYDIKSNLIIKMDNIIDNRIFIDAIVLKSGIYFYKLTNIKARKRSWGKFVIDR